METNPNTEGCIQHLDTMAGVRVQAETYIGPLDDPAAINTLLTESLCIALDNAASGCASAVDITIHENGAASVRDNGPGLSIEIVHNGMTTIEILLTQIYACREAKRSVANEALCGIGIIVTNALSRKLRIETVQDGWLWQQDYSCGKAEGPIQRMTPTSQRWQQITFEPDPEIFGSRRLSPDYFAEWFAKQNLDLGQAAVMLHYGNTSTRLNPASKHGD